MIRYTPFLRWAVWVLIVGGFSTAYADQEWYYYYELGLQQIRDGNAQAAVENLRRAIEKGPEPGPAGEPMGPSLRTSIPTFTWRRPTWS